MASNKKIKLDEKEKANAVSSNEEVFEDEEDGLEDFDHSSNYSSSNPQVNQIFRVAKISKPLTAEEEKDLGEKLKSEKHWLKEIARTRILTSCYRLVIKIARHYINRGVDFEDLIQYGIKGLVTALDRFDWLRGLRFSTTATIWIRKEIGLAILNNSTLIRIPSTTREKIAEFIKIEHNLAEANGFRPTLEQTIKEILKHNPEMTEEKIRKLLMVVGNPKSLDEEIKEGDEGSFNIYLNVPADQADDIFNNEIDKKNETLLSKLSDVEKKLVLMKTGSGEYDHEYSAKEICEALNITFNEFRNIQARVISKAKQLCPKK